MNLRENTDRVITFGQYAGFCYMVVSINIFCIFTFGAIPDRFKGLKLITIRFNNIIIVDVNGQFGKDLQMVERYNFNVLAGTRLSRCLVRHSTELTFLEFSWSPSTISVKRLFLEISML